MGLSEEAIKTILGIKEPVYLTTESMIENLTVTFFPFHKTTDKEILTFREKLEAVLKDLGVNILLYEQALGKRDKIKKGIAIIATGDGEPGNLAVDHVMNPRNNPIVTIVKEPPTLLDETASFEEHMNIAIKLFAYHMSNIIICAGKKEWIVYSLNGYSPLYKIEEDFSRRVSRALIPKLTAPIRPPLLSEFKIEEWDIDTRASFDRRYIKDIVEASRLFKKTALYPPARALETLSFRSTLYKKIGKRYLDRRSGMSYGFFVR